MGLGKKLHNKKIDGTVEEMVFGGPSRTRGFVEGGVVYEVVIGGPNRAIGYVKDGVAYEPVMGGPPRVIGEVKCHQEDYSLTEKNIKLL
jgi:hypothetical protein